LLAEARDARPFAAVVDANDPAFLPPGDMPGRIAATCRATGQPEPSSRAATVRCILDSLALAHRRAVREAVELSGHEVDVVHLVGGGSRNELLCQLTADARLAAADDVGAVDVVGGQVGERAAAAVGVLAWLLASQAR
jgi:rhamnulokinase